MITVSAGNAQFPKGVVPVVVGVDEVADGLVGHFAHPFQNLAPHGRVDVGVDYQHVPLAHDEAGVVHVGYGGKKRVHSRREFLRVQPHPRRVEEEGGEPFRKIRPRQAFPAIIRRSVHLGLLSVIGRYARLATLAGLKKSQAAQYQLFPGHLQ